MDTQEMNEGENMSSKITKLNASASVRSALENSLYPGAKKESIDMVLAYCEAAGLDPLQKPVHIVPMSVKQGRDYVWRDIVMPGIGLYRTQASRSGVHAGTSEPEFGPMIKEKIGEIEINYPEWCKVTVTKIVQGQLAYYTAKEYWIENYATAGKETLTPNSMWRRRSRGQLAKCTEAQALRKAFPELGAQPTAEEMEGKIIDITGNIISDDSISIETPYEIEHLPALRDAAMNGLTALQETFSKLPITKDKNLLWRKHSESLKGAAKKADESKMLENNEALTHE